MRRECVFVCVCVCVCVSLSVCVYVCVHRYVYMTVGLVMASCLMAQAAMVWTASLFFAIILCNAVAPAVRAVRDTHTHTHTWSLTVPVPTCSPAALCAVLAPGTHFTAYGGQRVRARVCVCVSVCAGSPTRLSQLLGSES